MKRLYIFPFFLSHLLASVCAAQVDIYQSSAYSLEEMCAREAEQSSIADYYAAYQSCITQNRDREMYSPENTDVEFLDIQESEPPASTQISDTVAEQGDD